MTVEGDALDDREHRPARREPERFNRAPCEPGVECVACDVEHDVDDRAVAWGDLAHPRRQHVLRAQAFGRAGRDEDVAGADADPDRLADLRFNLKTGGLLFADACCGREQFDKSFRVFMEQLFPDRKLEEVPLDDILFSKELNGIALTGDSIKCRTTAGKEPTRMAPALEGIKINNRWVVLYSKYDIGCALERHQSSECLGYDTGSAFKLAGAAALYLLRP